MATSSQSAHASNDSALVASLYDLSNKSPKLVKSTAYFTSLDASDARNVEIRSWKMNEYKYSVTPCPFPTLARGFFTREVREGREDGGSTSRGMSKFLSSVSQPRGKEKAQEKKYQIVARGYDKFFNIDEVPWTSWAAIEANTSPPYTLSLKSNGCIIFISAITPKKILVTSKHALGPISGYIVSHAEAGEKWLRQYMAESEGRSEEDLAKELWEKNWTAVAELCDDSFEEHVLAYPPDKTGLHLHGLNVRTQDFITMPTNVVDAFADTWGFIKTPTKVLNSVQEVRDFTGICAEKGEWQGEPVEGFVIRATTRDRTRDIEDGKLEASVNDRSAKAPYPPNSSFFFKVKFEEPYMMYRDWREITKTLVSVHSRFGAKALTNATSHLNLPKPKLKRPETKLYLEWVVEEIQKNPKLFDGYLKGKGIVSSRERFLEWKKRKDENGGDSGDTSVALTTKEIILD